MILKALLYLYPPAFRREFGDEIVRDLADGARDALIASGWTGLVAFWTVVSADLVRTAALEWVRSGWPSLIGVSAAWSLSCCALIARQFAPRDEPSFTMPRQGSENELVVMVLGATVLVIVIGATILVTCLFWMTVLRRKRRA